MLFSYEYTFGDDGCVYYLRKKTLLSTLHYTHSDSFKVLRRTELNLYEVSLSLNFQALVGRPVFIPIQPMLFS